MRAGAFYLAAHALPVLLALVASCAFIYFRAFSSLSWTQINVLLAFQPPNLLYVATYLSSCTNCIIFTHTTLPHIIMIRYSLFIITSLYAVK
jgi:hypothetical protein